jgi:His/Glu/Gln/Arg/opine family amino acid ABC transporter permease subunit
MSFDWNIVVIGMPLLLRGLLNTIIFSASAIALSMFLAPLVALARLSKRWWLRWPAASFVEVIRNTPFLIQAFLFFYGLAALGHKVDPTFAGIVTLTAYGTANFSESFRGAIQSVPRGQLEAARAVGMSYPLAMIRIIFPQMIGYLVPSLTNHYTGLIKECSVLSVITVPELAMAGQWVIGETFAPIEGYLMVSLLYWALTGSASWGMWLIWQRNNARQFAASKAGGAVQRRQFAPAIETSA